MAEQGNYPACQRQYSEPAFCWSRSQRGLDLYGSTSWNIARILCCYINSSNRLCHRRLDFISMFWVVGGPGFVLRSPPRRSVLSPCMDHGVPSALSWLCAQLSWMWGEAPVWIITHHAWYLLIFFSLFLTHYSLCLHGCSTDKTWQHTSSSWFHKFVTFDWSSICITLFMWFIAKNDCNICV